MDTPVPPPTALPAHVAVHYPPSAEAEAVAASEALRAAGIASVETLPVNFAITRSNVRFYHTGDHAAADTVAALIAPDPTGEAPEARDFTDYATPPAPGKIEVWLAGAPPERAPAQHPPRGRDAAAGTRPRQPAPTFTADLPQDQAEAVARILVERAYERLLQETPSR